MKDLNFRVSKERLNGVKIGILRKIEESTSAQFAWVAHFMTDGEDGDYLDEEDAYEVLDEYTLGDVEDIAQELKEKTEAVVPKA